MSFLNKNFSEKPCLTKEFFKKKCFLIPASIAAVAIAGYFIYSYKVKDTNSNSQESKSVVSSGLSPQKSVSNVADVEEVIAKWIESNPKAIIESVTNMQKREMEEQMKNAQKNISEKKGEIFSGKNAPSYAAGSHDIEIVEFFDYKCGYCKKAQGTVEQLLNSDKKIKIIYRELPILGEASKEMSEVALAVHLMDAKSYKKFHEALMKSNESGKAGAINIAKTIGIDTAKLQSTLEKEKEKIEKMIKENIELAQSIGVNGTPGFVIGEELIPGALDVEALKSKVADARKKK